MKFYKNKTNVYERYFKKNLINFSINPDILNKITNQMYYMSRNEDNYKIINQQLNKLIFSTVNNFIIKVEKVDLKFTNQADFETEKIKKYIQTQDQVGLSLLKNEYEFLYSLLNVNVDKNNNIDNLSKCYLELTLKRINNLKNRKICTRVKLITKKI